MKFRPIGKKILCKDLTHKEDKGEVKMDRGIIIPEMAKKFETSSKIVKILDISADIGKTNVKIGDEVMVNLYIGTEIEIDAEKYLLIESEDIYGIMHRPE